MIYITSSRGKILCAISHLIYGYYMHNFYINTSTSGGDCSSPAEVILTITWLSSCLVDVILKHENTEKFTKQYLNLS